MTLSRLRPHLLAVLAVVAAVALGVVWASRRNAPAATDEVGSCSSEGCAARVGEGGAAAALTGAPRLVAFTSEDCPACAKMKRIVADVERRCPADGAIARVGIDEAEGEALARTYRVRVVPTFVEIDADGREVARLVGERSLLEIQRAVEDVRGAACAPL